MSEIKPDKKLVGYCEIISVITIIAAAMYGFPNILDLCYELERMIATHLYGTLLLWV